MAFSTRAAGFGLWLGIPLLQAAGLLGLAAAHAPHAGTAVTAIVFPPWWTEERAVDAVRARGLTALPSAASFIAIVPDAAQTGTIAGEWFRLAVPKDFLCSGRKDQT